jgi:ABC-type glutathione transport system ATPase component
VLLEVKNLSKSFPISTGGGSDGPRSIQALSNVSTTLAEGETLAVVGGSGCGKSTLAKIIVGLLPPDEGEVLWEGKPLTGLTRYERARRVQMIFQDPYASLNPKLSVGTQLKECLVREESTGAASTEKRAAQLLESVGLTADVLNHYPFQFSGGQRQRIAIARALAMKPRLLIADEPLSALDVSVQSQILNLFKELKRTFHLTLLLITHDLAVAGTQADRILVLEKGKVVENGSAREVILNPTHAYTRALVDAVPRLA